MSLELYCCTVTFLSELYGHHQDLHGSIHSFPTRRSSDLGSIGLPRIVQPPDEAGVTQAPYEACVETAVAAVAPDEAGGRHVEEIVRDDLVLPDDSGGVQALGPDEAARQRRAGVPGHIAPLIALPEC